jgi:D-sedoheptulose 7-phosphate isomerase
MEPVDKYLEDLRLCLSRLPVDEILRVIETLHAARFAGRQVFVIGNGGSAATASHFACDLGKGTSRPGLPRFRVIALTDNMATFSAYANDVGYECVFVEQLANLLRPGDVVVGISGSGNSTNVLRALEYARHHAAMTIGFTGFDGGLIKDCVDLCVIVPSYCMEQVEDVHLILEHLVCTVLRQIAASGTPGPWPVVVPELQDMLPAGGDGH